MASRLSRFSLLTPLALVCTLAGAQTFRGTVTGTVVDGSGAAIPGATVTLANPATNEELKSTSNGAGDFSFPELNVGTYKLTVTAAGFTTRVIGSVPVEISKVNNQRVQLAVGAESEVVNVQAAGVNVDTTTSSLVAVVDSASVQNIPLNGRNFTQMTKLSAGVGAYSNTVNGSRTAGINFQLDGSDNNDPWSNNVASNQGGVAGIAGGLVPIEAIDQFSIQSSGESDQGRNGGANSNMVLKSGTNSLHGDVFYYDRNEYFAWLSPVQLANTRVPEIRNHQGGFTLGGPIRRDKTFFFLSGEVQIANANNSVGDTVVNDAWITDARRLLARQGVQPNNISVNLYNLLFPADAKGGSATTGNYLSNGRNTYNSYNGIIKLDHNFSDRYTISAHYLGTTGTQSADVGSHYADYFQTAPMHIHNFLVVQNSVFSSKLVNQILFAGQSFLQTFNDRNQSYDTQGTGLALGLTGILARGATQLRVGSFDYTGATAPLGRQDVTGHVTDTLHWTLGRHDLKLGGEFRHANLNVAYYTNGRGSFTFDGTRGGGLLNAQGQTVAYRNSDCDALGYRSDDRDANGHNCTPLKQVADFLAGTPQATSGATILRNNPQRVYLMNSFDVFAHDSVRLTPQLTVNYGVRWTYPGTVYDDRGSLYNFTPARGFFPEPLYARNLGNVAPRVGFSLQPFKNNPSTVLRGAYGLNYDQPTVGQFVYNNIGNTGATGIYSNPVGPSPVFAVTPTNFTFGVSTFPNTPTSNLGVLAINPGYRQAYMQNYNLNVEQQFTKSTLFTIAYAGSLGRRLAYISDINQINTATRVRPLTAQYPTLLAVNQVNGGASSNYNSLQLSLRQSDWHGISASVYYTWSKAMDYVSTTTTPMNSYDLRREYAPAAFDTRNTLTGFATYTVPNFTTRLKRLTQGYQATTLWTFAGGQPINVLVGTNVSGTGENKDRPNVVQGVARYVSRSELTSASSSARTYSFLNRSAWVSPVAGTGTTVCYCYGNERRNSVYGPGFGTVDVTLVKRTKITERLNSELRAEIFNIANQANFANPSGSISSSSFGVLTQTRNGSSAPGLGFGEPRNMQFAVKLSF